MSKEAKAEKQTKPEVEKLGGNPLPRMGPGLFDIDPRASESGNRALQALTPLLSGGAVTEASLDRLGAKLTDISRFYWADHDYDQQASFGDVKEELTRFGRKIKKFQSALGSLSTAAKYTIRATTRRQPLDPDELLQPAADKLQALSDVITRITSSAYKRGTAVSVKTCCASLWRLRENFTGQPFVGNFESGDDRKASEEVSREVFTAPDARFVQIAMEAIDSEVTFASIRTKLIELDRERSAGRAATVADDDMA